ncbi:MAG: hypothetical protein K0M45_04520, partial [Candidatus Paracaedibacteraceae bacterium]|nr:hypothetical protein [Candidatus Paracaedibacteraceae bacterium]
DVSQAIVVARTDELDKTNVDESNNKKLVAYVRPGDFTPSSTELREFLSERLPDYMVPSFFVYIDKVPLTSNGKIDRKALLDSTIGYINKNRVNIVYPATPLQFHLLKIWEKVLNLKNISIHDNFFEIGGNSLTSIKLFSQLQPEFSNKISIADIFRNPTIFSLSRVLELEHCCMPNFSLIPIQISEKRPALFLIHPGGGLSFCYQGLSKYIDDIPIYGINSPSFESPGNNYKSIQSMAEHYISLIKKIQNVGPYVFGGWSFGGIVAYEMAQQLTIKGESIENLILIDAAVPMNNLKNNGPHEKITNKKHLEKIDDALFNENSDLYVNLQIEKNLKIHENLILKYKVKKYRGGKVTLLIAKDNVSKTQSKVYDYGWKHFIKNLQIINVPGRHETLFRYNNLESTAKAIKLCIKSDNMLPIEEA